MISMRVNESIRPHSLSSLRRLPNEASSAVGWQNIKLGQLSRKVKMAFKVSTPDY